MTMTSSTNMTAEGFIVDVDNAPSIRFMGALLASVRSHANRAHGSQWSGESGRWTELALYQTRGGKYVCSQIGRTIWEGERDRHSAKVCETMEEVKMFFGYRWLAKALYDSAGIDYATSVE